MRGQRTDLPTAAQAKALDDMGYRRGQIADITGMKFTTIYDILHGKNGWDRIIRDDQLFNQYRQEQKRIMKTGSVELAKSALEQNRKKLPQASAAQSAMILWGFERQGTA